MTASAVGGAPPAVSGWALVAIRARLALVAFLVALAAGAWWWASRQMRGMDDGPWTGLGSFGWFLSVWVVMMVAMMFPSVSPTVALYAKVTARRSPVQPVVFAAGYLLVWAAAGVAAYAVARVSGMVAPGALGWDRAGRWVAAGSLAAAGVYELTPLKDVCLRNCRGPLGVFLGSWRGGVRGAVSMGVRNGTWCLGCCWALMLALFALGIMSVVWMAFVSALIGVEKLLPRQRVLTLATAALLVALSLLVASAPHAVPGLTVPTTMKARM